MKGVLCTDQEYKEVNYPHPGEIQLSLSSCCQGPKLLRGKPLGVDRVRLLGAWKVGLVDLLCREGIVFQVYGKSGESHLLQSYTT